MFEIGIVELMSVNHSARSDGIIGIFFDFLVQWVRKRYIVCSHKNRLIEAILTCTHTQHTISNINKTCHRDRIARLTMPYPSYKKL